MIDCDERKFFLSISSLIGFIQKTFHKIMPYYVDSIQIKISWFLIKKRSVLLFINQSRQEHNF